MMQARIGCSKVPAVRAMPQRIDSPLPASGNSGDSSLKIGLTQARVS